MREKPKDGFVSISEQEARGQAPPAPPASVSEDQVAGPYGRWRPAQEAELAMPDLQLPQSPDEACDDEKQVQFVAVHSQEEEVTFEEKVLEKKLSTGNETFKKRQVKPASRRNVRPRESSP